ncbi:MAG: CRTAC1 family protein [Bryobacter sp.]|nr:CRTAC1 family protein [Bryobacter sp.]
MKLLLLALCGSLLWGQGLQFTDITVPAGIQFRHNSGRAGKKWLPETMGSGVAFFDANGDGAPDLLLLNSKDWTKRGRRSLSALYKNDGKGKFTNVTAASGLDVEMYALGVAAADYDNDGRDDLYITAIEGDRLFHNEGNFKFKDVTLSAGIRNRGFGTSAAWLDYNKDGKADLFVANYVQWTPSGDLFCSLDGATKSYCTPESYKGMSAKLYKNLGGGKFQDATAEAKLADPTSKGLGVLVFDYNADTWPDLFVANDTQPNKLYRNNRNGTFAEEGVAAGIAFGEDGVARGAMGVDAGDYDRSGRPHLVVGNFSNQMLGLYHNEGKGLFVDEAPRSTVGRASLLSLAFGVFFFDADNDGWLDILAANGHIDEEINRVQPKVTFAQPPLLFRNLGANGKRGTFEDVSKKVGAAFQKALVARGAAYADIDRDGDLDIAINNNHGPALLLRNDAPPKNWVRFRLEGVSSNRSALGAVVRVQSAGGRQWAEVRSGASYLSQSDLTLHFGLGADTVVQSVEVEWPSGRKQKFSNVAARKQYWLREDADKLVEK